MSDRPTKRPNRELYLDALRTAAIIRVVTYHTFGGSWLSWLFPAMGVMFALAGGLMVRSLDKQPPLTVIKNRARRLLPALWLFGLIIIPVMIWGGGAFSNWTDPNTGEPVPFWKLIFWVVPIFDPPGNEFGTNFTVVLWYLRTYLWLVALSPLLLKAFRKWPVPTLVAPLGLVLLQAFGVLPSPDEGNLWDLVSTLGMFAPCWMLGFAHRTGKLKKVPMPALIALVAACAIGGIAWALGHPAQDADAGEAYDLNGIPLANALWSIAVIIPLLRFAPDASWIGRTPFLGRLVALVNNRAVTIYLWHNVMIDASYPIDDWLTRWLPEGLVENPAWDFLTVWVLVALCVLAFGWVEDLAARRKPRLFPVGPSAAERRAEHAAELAAKAAEDTPAPVAANAARPGDDQRPYGGPDQYGAPDRYGRPDDRYGRPEQHGRPDPYGQGQYTQPDRYPQQRPAGPAGHPQNGHGTPDAHRYQQYETGQYGAPLGGYDHPTADYNAEYRNVANHPTADYSEAYREARREPPRRNGYPAQRPPAEGQPEEPRRSRH
ncbi:acyltransferase family protein [Cryptosporangium arvum]|uniref:acyltransferase family protein n=1 Tax=Cryptosporangium arvum TaxID=80871 RepID=UPI00146FDB7B|nr:acyltransferase [Cryptosporangium arvum]